jgi:hypothetical protein
MFAGVTGSSGGNRKNTVVSSANARPIIFAIGPPIRPSVKVGGEGRSGRLRRWRPRIRSNATARRVSVAVHKTHGTNSPGMLYDIFSATTLELRIAFKAELEPRYMQPKITHSTVVSTSEASGTRNRELMCANTREKGRPLSRAKA